MVAENSSCPYLKATYGVSLVASVVELMTSVTTTSKVI